MAFRDEESGKGNSKGRNDSGDSQPRTRGRERVLRHVSITGLSSGIRDRREIDGSQIITRQECQRKEIGPDPVGVGAHSTIISAGS